MTKKRKSKLFSFETKYKILKFKQYFDRGFSILHYIRYLILFYGVGSGNAKIAVWMGVVYGIACFIVGYCWFKYDWVRAEAEIGNRHNLLLQRLRKHIIKGKV